MSTHIVLSSHVVPSYWKKQSNMGTPLLQGGFVNHFPAGQIGYFNKPCKSDVLPRA